MEMKKTKVTSLYMLFLMYLAAFFFFTILIIGVLMFCLYIGLWNGYILPSNYAEQAMKQAEKQIAQSEEFDESLIPFPCTYVLLAENGNILSTNVTSEEAEKVQEASMKSAPYSMEQYLLIQREDSICIVNYDMYAHFSSPFLHKWLPNPEILGIILFLIGFLSIAIIIAVLFGRKLKAELVPIIEATNAIKKQELHFECKPARIREFNTVLDSIKDMSVALEDSLKRQWSMEQHRKMQIAAITHDIKTPLTIIKGNTELLLESEQSLEEKEMLEYIYTSSGKVEKYLGLLMAATKAESEEDFQPESFSVKECITEIEAQARACCLAQNISLVTKKETMPDVFLGDRELIIRAVSNILDNAVEHTLAEGKIEFYVSGNNDKLIFVVADSGNGFTQNSLKCATRQFYTENEERAGKHYGLGLFIAKSVAQKHGGNLLLANKSDGCGAVVTLTLRNTSNVNGEATHF